MMRQFLNVLFIIIGIQINTIKIFAQEVRTAENILGDAVFSNDGKNILTTSGQLWDLKTGKVVRNFNKTARDGNGEINFYNAAFSKNDKYIVFNRNIIDGTSLQILDSLPYRKDPSRLFSTNEKHAVFMKPLDGASFSGDYSKILSHDEIFDMKTKKCVTQLKPNPFKFGSEYLIAQSNLENFYRTSIQVMPEFDVKYYTIHGYFTPDLKYYVSPNSNDNKEITFWKIAELTSNENFSYKTKIWYNIKNTKIKSITLGDEPKRFSFSTDGNNIIILDNSNKISVFNVSDGEKIMNIKVEKLDYDYNVGISNSKLLIFSSQKESTKIYDIKSKKVVSELPDFFAEKSFFSPNDKYLINGKNAEVWDINKKTKLCALPDFSNVRYKSAHLTENNLAVFQYTDGTARIFDAVSGQEKFLNIIQNINTLQFNASTNGKWAASSDWNGEFTVWNPISGEQVFKSSTLHQGLPVSIIEFDTLLNKVYTFGFDGNICSWSLPDMKPISNFKYKGKVQNLYVLDNALAVADENFNYSLSILEPKNGAITATINADYNSIPAIYQLGTLILSGSDLYNYRMGIFLKNLTITKLKTSDYKSGRVLYLGYSSKQTDKFFSINKNGFISTWDLNSGNISRCELPKDHEGKPLSNDVESNIEIKPGFCFNNYFASEISLINFEQYTYSLPLRKIKEKNKIHFSSDEVRISKNEEMAAILQDGKKMVNVYECKTGSKISSFEFKEKFRITDWDFLTDNNLIVTTNDKTTGIADPIKGTWLTIKKIPSNRVSYLATSPKGKWIVFAHDIDSLTIMNATLDKIIFHDKIINQGYEPHLVFSLDEKYLILNGRSTFGGGKIALIDIEKGVVKHLGELALYSSFSSDSKHLITTMFQTEMETNTMNFYNPENLEKKVSAIQLSNGKDIILFTPDQFYLATKGALNALHFAKGKQAFTFDQFDLRFNRPDIVFGRLGNKSKEQIALYKKAWEKRVKKMGFNPADFDGKEIKLNTPEVTVLTSIPLTTEKTQLNFPVKATDNLYAIDRLHVYQNGVPIYGAKGKDIKTLVKKSKQFELNTSVDIELLNGKNIIEVSVINAQGIESIRERMEITSTAPAKPSDTYIVTIGVSHYKDSTYNLTYASKDASDLNAILQLGDSQKHIILTDKNATRENILKAKETLMQTKVNDAVVVFYAGHGLLDEKLDYYLATTDVNFANPSQRGLAYDDLEGLLDGIPARKKVLLMDACHSGEVDKEDSKLVTESQITNSSVKSRGFKTLKKTNMGLQNSFDLMQQLFADLSKGTGTTVISSASGAEYAFESEAWKNGVFTYSLLEGLKSKNADSNKDGQIMISELRDYVISNVQKLTNGKQNPTSRKENLEYDFKIW